MIRKTHFIFGVIKNYGLIYLVTTVINNLIFLYATQHSLHTVYMIIKTLQGW